MEEIIKEVYYNPRTGLGSPQKLYKKLKGKFPDITISDIRTFIKKQETNQVNTTPKIRPTQYNQIRAFGLGELEIDLLDLSNYKGFNNQYRYILMVCDTYSRKLWTRPLRKKTGDVVLSAMKSIEKDIKIPISSIICDKGSEFGNGNFKEHFKDANIFYKDPDTFNSSLAIVDRMCRTLRDLLNRYFVAYKTKKYIDVLQKLVENINNTVNSTIKNTPNDVWAGKAINEQTPRPVETLTIGDRVRIKNKNSTFDKKNTSNYSTEIYTVEKLIGLGYGLSGKRKKYFISELMSVSSSETPNIRITRQTKDPTEIISQEKTTRKIKRLLNSLK